MMADSTLPLKIWFDAIQRLFVDPDLSSAELQRRMSIRRVATVRALARRVRTALTTDDCTTLLAGLDQKLAQVASSVPSPGKKLTNAATMSSGPESKRNPLAKLSLCCAASQVTPQLSAESSVPVSFK
jgi:hypothetical protein